MQRALKQAGICFQYSSRYEWSTVFAAKLNWHYATSHNCQAQQLSAMSHAAVQTRLFPYVSEIPSATPGSFWVQGATPSARASSLQRTCGYSTSSVDKTRIGTPYTVSNAISLLRLMSAPGVAWLIATEQWELAVAAVAVAGFSDWLDGYLAKALRQESVLGSYLDPLADKAVVGAAIGALAWTGSIPAELGACVLGRDVLLVSAHFYHRAKVLGWKFKSAQEFFKTSDNASSSVEAAERVQPLFTGKVSTAVQFGLIATCTVTGALGFAHGNQYVQFWVINTFLWTALSGLQYLYICNWLSDSFKLRAVGATTLALAAYQYRRGGLECFQM